MSADIQSVHRGFSLGACECPSADIGKIALQGDPGVHRRQSCVIPGGQAGTAGIERGLTPGTVRGDERMRITGSDGGSSFQIMDEAVSAALWADTVACCMLSNLARACKKYVLSPSKKMFEVLLFVCAGAVMSTTRCTTGSTPAGGHTALINKLQFC